MRVNPYYNKDTMNLKQLTCDLEKQNYTCVLSEEDECLYVCISYGDHIEIALTDYKDWCIACYQAFKDVEIYHASTNWGVIKLLRKLLKDAK